MSTRSALKAAKAALDSGDYDQAIEQSRTVLDADSSNYFARLFLARAQEKLKRYDAAATEYRAAADAKPDDVQAWLGLCSVFEAQEGAKLDEHREVAARAAELLAKVEDGYRCQSVVDKLLELTKRYGSRRQQQQALRVILPGSPVYEFLEGRVPAPAHTYSRLATLVEEDEAAWIAAQIADRRTRIGARVGQVSLEVRREAYATSELAEIYQNVVDWATDDEVRREFERNC